MHATTAALISSSCMMMIRGRRTALLLRIAPGLMRYSIHHPSYLLNDSGPYRRNISSIRCSIGSRDRNSSSRSSNSIGSSCYTYTNSVNSRNISSSISQNSAIMMSSSLLTKQAIPKLFFATIRPLSSKLQHIVSASSYEHKHVYEHQHEHKSSGSHFQLISSRGFAVTGRASKNAAPKKNKLDLMKTKLYAKIGIKIVMAAKKEGGIDPKVNKELAQALHTAHVNNLPKDNIDRALRRASEKASEDYKAGVYEVYGHGGVGIIVTTLSDNSNRANMAVKSTARKADAKMAASGSVLFSFDLKGVIRVNFAYSEEDIIELALEAGLDNVDFLELPSQEGEEVGVGGESSTPVYKSIVTDTTSMVALEEAIIKKYRTSSDASVGVGVGGLNKAAPVVITAEFEYIPKERVEVDDDIYDLNMKLIESFEDLDDVDVCYHNIA